MKSKQKRKRHANAITDQNKRLKDLANKDDLESIYKKILDRVVKEGFDEMRELTCEINLDDLIY